MGRVVYHDEFGANVQRLPNGDLHLSMKDADIPEIHVFPMGNEQAIKFADKIKKEASGLEIASEMPKGTNG